jgi:hypothetical protein
MKGGNQRQCQIKSGCSQNEISPASMLGKIQEDPPSVNISAPRHGKRETEQATLQIVTAE